MCTHKHTGTDALAYVCVFVGLSLDEVAAFGEFDWQTLSVGPERLHSHCKLFIGEMLPRRHLGSLALGDY